MKPGYKHAPGVACIVTGLRGPWARLDNGRIVVITEHGGVFRGENLWRCRVRDGEEPLHSFSSSGRCRSHRVRALQRLLIPIGPEGVFPIQEYRDAYPEFVEAARIALGTTTND